MMKKSFYLLPALALALASCSSEDPITGDDNYNGPIETSYLTVNISTAGTSITRAATDGEESEDYEDGKGKENEVKSVRFYFFDAFGNSVKVKNSNGTLQNYMDLENPGTDDTFKPDETENIEKVLSKTLIINSEAGDKKPASVVAILNPTSDVTEANITTLEGLTNSLNSVVCEFPITENSSFVMSNSVYADGANKIEAVAIQENQLCTTEKAAMDNPVDIYVERINAKVRVGIDSKLSTGAKTDDNDNLIVSTGVQNTTNTEAGDDPDIYVKLLGWNVTSTPNKSRLMKEIDPTWTNTALFEDDIWNWSSTTRHRSFWAVNPTLNYSEENLDYDFGNFANAYAHKFVTTDEVYVQENASQSTSATELAPAYPTKVIIAAQLVDENGKELELAEWGTILYKKDALLNHLASLANVYSYTKTTETTQGDDNSQTTTDKETWTKLDGSYFNFVSAEDLGKAGFSTPGRYNSYIQLDPEKITEGMQLTMTNGDKENFETPDQINPKLLSLDPVKVWENGKTYYYFDIQHLGSEGSPAEFGVVRNHIYECNIESIKGLGTPVFIPDGTSDENSKTIYPEKPDDDITMIAARINILNWRLVKSNVGISWP